jgi:crotonobetainyl-CoA:carnitine CoA-transferase CaiB-like acyl-CoA transferase
MLLVKQLALRADVLIHNFRPGIMESFGLDYTSIKKINPQLIYTEISGYGKKGPWKKKPGQDLLIQAMSGLTYSTGNKKDHPMPFGLAISDYLCGNQTVQAILAALIRRYQDGKGSHLELSLMESLVDFQFEFFTTYFQTNKQHSRSHVNNGHSLLSAPYGLYQTADGYIAVAMIPLEKLNHVIQSSELKKITKKEVFEKRDEIKSILKKYFITKTSGYWIKKMKLFDLWVMPVLNWNQLIRTSTYKALKMEQEITPGSKRIKTTRCPISINKELFLSDVPAPELGEHTEKIKRELARNIK